MACAKIIISSNVKVLKEIVKEKKNVLFVRNFNNVFSWKIEIDKIKFLHTKRFIISQNNFKLSKNFRTEKRAKIFLENLS
jgi:hypothetical protein